MAARKGKGSRVTPSREKYEESHPVVSVRVSPEMREDLEEVNTASGMSIADVLRVGLDKAKPAVEEAFHVGYYDAMREYEVEYWCDRCGERHVSLTSAEEKEAAAAYMYDHGWHDTRCR